ncbi:DNRLRE domain-containing protein [Paenibacillus sp. LHD-117]|uniref:CBM96 family carbohydrate-binding protein n=1 Tax=Paenibacillus sp. LHD-117 TaxID=3071412 RepID=UPI0027DF9A71|nr:DNRLRE domain-containing protein [Paenibacillus sp. LHD-117]MDQ6422668.1 DNRLRE domain-containing protein [Paenibacillus sp. LHD-117]
MMQGLTRNTALLLACLLLASVFYAYPGPEKASAANTTYYVDSIGGDDANGGTTQSSPWKSLAKVNATTFQPGDRILFRTDRVWTGQLWPKGSGVSGNPIIIDQYGAGSKPIINGAGTTYPVNVSGAVMLYNQQHWEINNLEVTNYSTTVISARAGILAYNSQAGVNSHIYVRDCYVHDVNSNVNGNKITGGIIFFGTHIDKDGVATLGVQAGFNDVLVENNHVANVTKEGIRIKSDAGNNQYPRINTDIVFRGNFVEEVFGDGMVLAEVASGALAEYNIIKNHSKTNTANYAGLWTHYTTGALIQYNEVYGGTGGYNDGEAFDSDINCDGEAFDSDINCDGDVFQYNYSHDNSGGLLLVMPNAKNLKFRYNISQNDGYRSGQEIFHYPNNVASNQIYNNTIYIGPSVTTQIFKRSGTATAKFYNNIIKADGTVSAFASSGTWSASTEFRNNGFYPASIAATNGPASHPGLVSADPLLVAAGSGGSNIDMTDANRLPGYKLQSASSLINSGMYVGSNGGKDFWGNALYTGSPDIGAYESDVDAPATLNIPAEADSYVRDGGYAASNYGTAASMTVKSDASGYARKAYVKVDFGGFAGTTAESAKLRLYVSSVNAATTRTVSLYGTTDENWTETGITWNNAPAGTTFIGSAAIGNTAGEWVEFDVTAYVNGQMADKRVSFLLVNEGPFASTGDVSFGTREAVGIGPVLALSGGGASSAVRIDAGGTTAFMRRAVDTSQRIVPSRLPLPMAS